MRCSSRVWCVFLLGLLPAAPGGVRAGEMAWIGVSDDGRGFVQRPSGEQFVPWGFNYDHDPKGRLIEDYWDTEWATVEEDFREMRSLGANVVRVHLQFGRFMQAPDKPNAQNLDRLEKLLRLAEQLHLYLDITGLGCYHKADVPDWYDRLEEADRWQAQAVFWEAIAARCARSPAVFCYDLMNEPVVPGARRSDDWLGPAFAGKHFVQRIALESKGRPRHEIARQWIHHLVTAIRKHDRRHLITVGLVPWSLDRPGLTSGFVPAKIAGELDFVAVHIYPEGGRIDDALETLRGFAVGKPVLIEETFPLKCSVKELEQFLVQSRSVAAGWIGFYWGKKPDEYQPPKSIAEALAHGWLELFVRLGPSFKSGVRAAR